MPIDERRRDAIAAAVAAYNAADPDMLLPPEVGRLLAVMFPGSSVCQRSLVDLAAEGFDRQVLPRLLRVLVEAGFLSKEPRKKPSIYRLHLPPQRRP
jgi:hypothetical protein